MSEKEYFNFFNGKNILVIGGTGSVGIELVKRLLDFNPNVIRIMSNDEDSIIQAKLKLIPKEKNPNKPKLRFIEGDVRELDRMIFAVNGIDYVFNAAAKKHVDLSEYDTMEAVKTNIIGLHNIIIASMIQGVKKIIHMSTDKAVYPTTVMGATKLISEKLCISSTSVVVACVRFGNVLGSSGSIIPKIKKRLQEGNTVTLTHTDMKRFVLPLQRAVDLLLKAMLEAQGGEIFVLLMPTMKIKDLIEVIIEEYCPMIDKDPNNVQIELVGAGVGEKLNEVLLTDEEFPYGRKDVEMYRIYQRPDFGQSITRRKGDKLQKREEMICNTKYTSALTKQEIKIMLKKYNLI